MGYPKFCLAAWDEAGGIDVSEHCEPLPVGKRSFENSKKFIRPRSGRPKGRRAPAIAFLGFSFVLAALLNTLLLTTATAMVRITDDHGGNIGAYWSRYMTLRDAGEQIVIDGTCSSACTLVLAIVPHDRICVTANAVLGFHAAGRLGFLGATVINDPGTRTLWNVYPTSIRQWISRHGGLGPRMIYLSGSELFAMYRQCR